MASAFDGISLQTAQEILQRSGIGMVLTSELSPKLTERLAESMRGFLHRCLRARAMRTVQRRQNARLFRAFPYETYPAEMRKAFQPSMRRWIFIMDSAC